MRVPKKRELAALWLLYSRGGTLNLGEAVDILRDELCMTKRTASNVIKRLKRLGVADIEVKENEIRVKVKSPFEVLKTLAEEYISRRRSRCKVRRLRDEEGRTL
jgi:DNA-binding MarR family transcriptional regulator